MPAPHIQLADLGGAVTPGVLPYWPSHATFLSRVMQHASTRCWRWAQQRPRRVEGPTAPLRLPEAAQHASNLDDLARAQRAGRWRGSLGLFSRGGPLLATSNACLSPMLSSWWAATWSSCPAGRPTSEQARAARSVPPSAPPSMQGARYRSMPEGARPSPGESDTAWARRERYWRPRGRFRSSRRACEGRGRSASIGRGGAPDRERLLWLGRLPWSRAPRRCSLPTPSLSTATPSFLGRLVAGR